MHKFLFIILILSSLSLFAQQREGESVEDYKKRRLQELGVAFKEDTPEPAPESETQPTEETADQNQDVTQGEEGLEESVDQAVEDLAGMGGMGKEGQPLEYKNEEVKPVKVKESFLTKMMDSETKNFLGIMMAKSPFADMKRETIEEVFIARNQGNPLGSFLKNNDKARNILVDTLKHPKALPQIVSLINKPEKIKYMGIFAGVVFALVFLANLMNSKGGLIKRILTKFAIGAAAGVLNLGFFIYLFHEDLKPVINIFFKYYHF